MTGIDLGATVSRLRDFEAEAHLILSRHEGAKSRVVVLDKSYRQVSGLGLAQDDLFRQALRCAEHELFRAAHVMAFAGFMSYVFEKLSEDALTAVRRERPSWRGADVYEMAEYYPDRQFIELTGDVRLSTKNDIKQMTSLLDRRNECAHPSSYYPDLNMTLGYIGETLHAVNRMQQRHVA